MLEFINRILHGRISSKIVTPIEIGRFGEYRALEYLRRVKKFRIICRNWKYRHGEIDLVAWDNDVLVFIEVRTRRKSALVPGFYTVGYRKKNVLRRTCQAYMNGLRRPPNHFRFDIVEVNYGKENDFSVSHFENIELFSKYYHPN